MSNRKSTTLIELVETHNIALSLNRLVDGSWNDTIRWRRALYHAISISSARDISVLKRIREALELP